MPTDQSERFRGQIGLLPLATRCDPTMDHGLFLTFIADAS